MATNRLKIYNGACLLLGELRLSSLTEDREVRYLLDEVYNDEGIRYCLEQAQWYFAMRATRLDFNPSVEPAWGYKRAFTKPDDWVATSGIWEDEYLTFPLIGYADEAGFWYADRQEIYVKYVSDDVNFGLDFARWPSAFTDYVKAYFAGRVVHKVPGSQTKIEYLLGPPGRENRGHVNHTLLIARNKAAMTQPVTFPQRGTWALARYRGLDRSFRDRGNIHTLIG